MHRKGDGGFATDNLIELASRRREVAKLLNLLASDGETRSSAMNATGEAATDEIDVASSVQGREAAATLAHVLSANQTQIDRAMDRIIAGGYGTCEDCLAVIPIERLRANPEATRCIHCQRRDEMATSWAPIAS